MSLKKSLIIIALILVVDQISKIYIKTSFILGEAHEVFSWFKILFIENEGAAWGTKLSDLLPISEPVGKLILTIFRIFASFIRFSTIFIDVGDAERNSDSHSYSPRGSAPCPVPLHPS